MYKIKNMIKKYNDWVDFSLNESVQFPTDHDEIKQILKDYYIKNYSIRPDGTVDVNGDVNLQYRRFEYFPVKFGIVKRIFKCLSCDNLKTLEGAPEKCNYFSCEDCINLKTLEGAPKECIEFNCACCVNLEYSLEHFPKCKDFYIRKTPFKPLYDIIGNDNFIKLINTNSDFEFESILAIEHSKGLNFEEYIKPLLKDKTMTEETFKHTYRGAVAGERFRF